MTNTTSHPAPPASTSGGSRPRVSFASQAAAMFVDAYREINARKMFWITLVISALIVGAFALVGFNENGYTIGWKQFDDTFTNTRWVDRATLYKQLFLLLGVNLWLTWLAIILALVSTSGLFPDFIAGGSIDLYLVRPLGRLWLFVLKYLAGLTFVALQVTVFCLVSFLVLGLRGGAWIPGIFVAVPLVTLLFSYLFSACVLIGMVTRSTIASLLLVILCWCGLFAIEKAEHIFLTLDLTTQMERANVERQIEQNRLEIERLSAATRKSPSPPGSNMTAAERSLQSAHFAMEGLIKDRDGIDVDVYRPWYRLFHAADYLLPKTGGTTLVIYRTLEDHMNYVRRHARRDPLDEQKGSWSPSLHDAADEKAEGLERQRSIVEVLATSIGFEVAVLALAAWIFCRRDY